MKKIIGTNLKTARKNAHMTQEQFAKMNNMVREQYGKYERGTIELDYEKMYTFCKQLDTTPNELFGFDD